MAGSTDKSDNIGNKANLTAQARQGFWHPRPAGGVENSTLSPNCGGKGLEKNLKSWENRPPRQRCVHSCFAI